MTDLVLIQCKYLEEEKEFEFDQNDDIDILKFQIISLFDNIDDNFAILDFCGREITSLGHILEAAYSTGEDASMHAIIWIVDRKSLAITSTCTKAVFGEHDVIQPYCR